MSLATRKQLHAFIWTELPINDQVISRLNDLSTKEKHLALDHLPVWWVIIFKCLVLYDLFILSIFSHVIIVLVFMCWRYFIFFTLCLVVFVCDWDTWDPLKIDTPWSFLAASTWRKNLLLWIWPDNLLVILSIWKHEAVYRWLGT